MLSRQVVASTSIALFSVFGLLAAPDPPAKPVDFIREVRPILSDKCFQCHGPDVKTRMVDLRLDTREGAFAVRKNGAVIIPGDPSQSTLVTRIQHEKKAMRMPPPASGITLSDAEIDILKRWIQQGAKWQMHWAYAPPVRPELPALKNEKWVQNPIDRFVLARLEQDGLEPSPEADKRTLLRRVTFDLTGLPPTPPEIEAFLKDKSPRAYEAVVDRLLASTRYGERMAMQWLDLARYADTHGYHIDSHRDMWPWRDWVIRAFNRNMPFDQFTEEQLAGDLLPNRTREQLIATAFNRNHMINFEGGAIADEYLTEYVVDRVDTTSTIWMGMTMGCARCHDHKYDPIKQKEFYQLYAFFNNVSEKGLDGKTGNADPFLALPTPEQELSINALNCAVDQLEQDIYTPKLESAVKHWRETRLSSLPLDPRDGLLAHYEMDGGLNDSSGRYQHGRTLSGEVTFGVGQIGRGASFNGEARIAFGVGQPDSAKSFSIAAWLKSGGVNPMVIFEKNDGTPARRGFQLSSTDSIPLADLKRGAFLEFALVHRWPDDAVKIRTVERVYGGDWIHLTINYDGSGKASGIGVFVDGKPQQLEVLRDSLSGPIANEGDLELGKERGGPFQGQIDDLRFYDRTLTTTELDVLATHHPIRSLLLESKLSSAQRAKLREYYLARHAPEEQRKMYAQLLALGAEQKQLQKTIPTVMVMSERKTTRPTHVLGRGDYRNKGEEVSPGVPSFLPPLPEGQKADRLALAKWLTDPAHPLTSRVAVNRYWQTYFGTGLVKTVEDFGSQGESPSHPQLLDWLATEFVRTGWDVKGMQRLIVTSATYRQSSRMSPDMIERDPENRLLSRGPRLRLPAEMIRDAALTAGGLLNPAVGGPSVFPYQPPGVWEELAYGGIFSAQIYTPSHGSDLYRRSMYTFWKRTAPNPALTTFDAPDREKCTARRPLTNTPLQALVLMNDPTFIEAARALAQRMITDGGSKPAQRIAHGFQLVTARAPSGREAQIMRQLASEQLAHFERSREAALRLVNVGESTYDDKLDPIELAAWTTVASAMLNLDEAITKE